MLRKTDLFLLGKFREKGTTGKGGCCRQEAWQRQIKEGTPRAFRTLTQIRILSECLSACMEGDGPAHPYSESCGLFLDDLDVTHFYSGGELEGGPPRGIFRSLLCLAFGGSPAAAESVGSDSCEKLCRMEALECLLILFYQRMSPDVSGMDLGLILVAVGDGRRRGMRIEEDEKRLHVLICAESLSLWRFLKEEQDRHPFFERAEGSEIRSLVDLFQSICCDPQLSQSQEEGTRESLLLWSFGIFLLLSSKFQSDHVSPSTAILMEEMGNSLTNTANQMGAFSYFHGMFSTRDNIKTPALHGSIGREILIGSMVALEGKMNRSEDIILLSRLTSRIYNSEEALCLEFWRVWEDHVHQQQQQQQDIAGSLGERRICHLVDTSRRISILSSSNAIPFLELMSGLCFDENTVRYALESNLIPESMIQRVIFTLAKSFREGGDDKTLVENLNSLLFSLSSLAKCGDDISIKSLLCNSITTDGMKMLHQMVLTVKKWDPNCHKMLSTGLSFFSNLIVCEKDSSTLIPNLEYPLLISHFLTDYQPCNNTTLLYVPLLRLLSGLIKYIPSILYNCPQTTQSYNYLHTLHGSIVQYVIPTFLQTSTSQTHNSQVTLQCLEILIQILSVGTVSKDNSIQEELLIHYLPSLARPIASLAVLPLSASLYLYIMEKVNKDYFGEREEKKMGDAEKWDDVFGGSDITHVITQGLNQWMEGTMNGDETVNTPSVQKDGTKIEIAMKAMELLLLWGECVSNLQLDKRDMANISPMKYLMTQSPPPPMLENDEDMIYLSNMENYLWKLQQKQASVSPCASFWPKQNVSFLNLFLQYLVQVDTADERAGVLAVSALKVLELCLYHDLPEIHTTLLEGSNSRVPSRVQTCLTSNHPNEDHNSGLKIQIMNILIAALRRHPRFILNLFSNYTKEQTASLCRSFLHDVGNATSLSTPLSVTTASKIMTFLAILWEECRNNTHHECHSILSLFKDNAAFENIWEIALIILDGLPETDHDQDHCESQTPNSFIPLASATLRLVTSEIFASVGGTEEGSPIVSMLKQSMDEDKFDSWGERITNIDDGGSAMIESYANLDRAISLLDRNRLFSPEDILFAAGREREGDDAIARENTLKHVLLFLKNLAASSTGEKLAPVLNLSQSIESLMTSQERMRSKTDIVTSWSRFIRVTFLCSNDSQAPIIPEASPLHKRRSPSQKLSFTPESSTRRKGSCTTLTPGPTKDLSKWCKSVAHQTLISLSDHAKKSLAVSVACATAAMNSSSSFNLSSTYSHVKIAEEYSGNLLTLLQVCDFDIIEAGDMMGMLLHCCVRLFGLSMPFVPNDTETNAEEEKIKKMAFQVGCSLRLNLLHSTLLLLEVHDSSADVNATPTKSRKKSVNARLAADRKRRFESRLGFADLVCDALQLLKNEPSGQSSAQGQGRAYYEYSFGLDGQAIGLNLLQTCLSLLKSLLHSNSSSTYLDLASSYTSDLAGSFQRGELTSSLMYHLETACQYAAKTYNPCPTGKNQSTYQSLSSNGDSTSNVASHAKAVNVAGSIIEFVNLAAASPSNSKIVTELLRNGSFFQLLIKNPLFQVSTRKWSAWTNEEGGSGMGSFRGYILLPGEQQARNRMFQGRFNHTLLTRSGREDPVHTLWRSSLGTLTSILRFYRPICSGSAGGAVMTNPSLDLVIDFLCAYEHVILSSLQGTSIPPTQNTAGNTHHTPKSSAQTFTANNLKEACETLSLISELCHNQNRDYFETASPSLYRRLLSSTWDILRNLSAFIGSASVARDLFSAVANINRAMEEVGGAASPSSPSRGAMERSAKVHAAFYMNPLLSGGLPNARHEAISHAHYASSCCLSKTAMDCADAGTGVDDTSHPSEAIIEVGADSGNGALLSLEGFQIHVNNEFVRRMEIQAAECLFHALTVLSRAHPAVSSFVSFDAKEASRVNCSALIKPGSVIALRDNGEFMDTGDDEGMVCVRYARVLRCNVPSRTCDVAYINTALHREQSEGSPQEETERNVSISRFSGIEDASKRTCVLAYCPAPKSVSDAASGEISVGHIVLILRWCKQRVRINANKQVHFNYLAECASLLLAMEVSLHRELGNEKQADDELVKKMNSQLIELFDEDASSSNADPFNCVLGTPDADNSVTETGLKNVLDEGVWTSVTTQLHDQLQAGKKDRESLKEKIEQKTYSSRWVGGVRRGERRSPFR